MIHINTHDIPEPASLLTGTKHSNLLTDLIINGEEHEVIATHYQNVGVNKKEHFEDKCWYCETKVEGGPITLDHYRPRGKVSGDKSQPGRYYWLAYEWTNLVPACQLCNSRKSSLFPVDGTRKTVPPTNGGALDIPSCHVESKYNKDELPLMLHPEFDHPEEHLSFSRDGSITAKSRRGEFTIRVCKLNSKHPKQNRKKHIDDFFRKMSAFVDAHLNGIKKKDGKRGAKLSEEGLLIVLNVVFTDLKESGEPHQKFSLLGKLMYNDFETFFIPKFEETLDGSKIKTFIAEAFANFREYGTCLIPKTNSRRNTK